MKCVIQTVPVRHNRAVTQSNLLGLPCSIYVDEKMSGTRNAFIKTLETFPSGVEYRLHMQDDIILSPGLIYYLPELEQMMSVGKIDYLSLYAPRRVEFSNALSKGKTIHKARRENFMPMLCTILSPRMVNILQAEKDSFTPRSDDVYVAHLLKKFDIPAYFHIPSLAQHDVGVPSSIGNPNNPMRNSAIFDDNYIAKKMVKKNNL